MKAKAVILGGAGFIGFHLARELLANRYNVYLVDNFSRGVRDSALDEIAADPDITLLESDLAQQISIGEIPDDVDHIYHLAAIVGVQHVLERPFDVLRYNIRMLDNALDFARKQRSLKRFVFASTSEVYAGTLRHFTLPIPTPEGTPLAITPLEEPRTSYMLSKIYGEAMCYQSGLPVTLIRPHNFYGPRMGMSHVIPQLLERAHRTAEGDDFDVYSVDHERTFIFIDDAVKMIRRAAETSSCESEVINIGNQEPIVKIGDLAEIIQRVVGKDLNTIPKPAAPGSPTRRCPDMEKAIRLTGYSPQTSILDGIDETYSWYRENVFDGSEISAQ